MPVIAGFDEDVEIIAVITGYNHLSANDSTYDHHSVVIKK